MRKSYILLIGIIYMLSNLVGIEGEDVSMKKDIDNFCSISEFTDLNYYLFCDTAVNANITDIEHDYAIIGNNIDNIDEGKLLYQIVKDNFIQNSDVERDMDIVYISPDCKWVITEKNVGLIHQILFYQGKRMREIDSEYSAIDPIIVIKRADGYEGMEEQLHEKLTELDHECYLNGYRGELIVNEQGDLAVAVKVKGSDYQQLDILDIEKEKTLWSFSLESIQTEIWANAIQFYGNQDEGIIMIQCGRFFYEVEYPSNEINCLGKDMYSLCYSPDKKYIAYSSIDHESGMGIGGDEMIEAGSMPSGIYVLEVETGKTAYVEINMEWWNLNKREFLWIEKESFDKYMRSNENLKYENTERTKIDDEEEYINPYAEYTETFSGGYLYDIYEANRGSSADGDWFINGSERFTYYKLYNFDESRTIKWCIELAEMKGTDNLAKEFNHYHDNLFESQKEKMEKNQKKVIGMNVDELDVSLERYGNQIYTRASFWWGNIFTVVDIVDPHYQGCHTVIANFNSVSGKQYELEDLFSIDNYTEELSDIIKAQLDGDDNGWGIELEFPERLSFVIGYRGLLLINASSKSILIDWDALEGILSPEMCDELKSLRKCKC